jgi:hypothetical protein
MTEEPKKCGGIYLAVKEKEREPVEKAGHVPSYHDQAGPAFAHTLAPIDGHAHWSVEPPLPDKVNEVAGLRHWPVEDVVCTMESDTSLSNVVKQGVVGEHSSEHKGKEDAAVQVRCSKPVVPVHQRANRLDDLGNACKTDGNTSSTIPPSSVLQPDNSPAYESLITVCRYSIADSLHMCGIARRAASSAWAMSYVPENMSAVLAAGRPDGMLDTPPTGELLMLLN